MAGHRSMPMESTGTKAPTKTSATSGVHTTFFNGAKVNGQWMVINGDFMGNRMFILC